MLYPLSYGRMGCRPRIRAIRQPRHSIPRGSISPIERNGSSTASTRLGGQRRCGQDGVIASNNPNLWHATDGKGIDHAFAAYGEQIFGSYVACGVELEL